MNIFVKPFVVHNQEHFLYYLLVISVIAVADNCDRRSIEHLRKIASRSMKLTDFYYSSNFIAS